MTQYANLMTGNTLAEAGGDFTAMLYADSSTVHQTVLLANTAATGGAFGDIDVTANSIGTGNGFQWVGLYNLNAAADVLGIEATASDSSILYQVAKADHLTIDATGNANGVHIDANQNGTGELTQMSFLGNLAVTGGVYGLTSHGNATDGGTLNQYLTVSNSTFTGQQISGLAAFAYGSNASTVTDGVYLDAVTVTGSYFGIRCYRKRRDWCRRHAELLDVRRQRYGRHL